MKNILAPVLDNTKYRSCFTNLTMFMDNEGSFVRASSATVWKDGVLTTVGVDVARFADGSEIGDTIGYISEGASTNLILYSDELDNPVWTATGVTVTANYGTAPDGTLSADRLVNSGAGNLLEDSISGLSTASKDYVVSCFVKGTGGFRLKNTHGAVIDNFSPDLVATSELVRHYFAVSNSASAGNGTQIVGIKNDSTDSVYDIEVSGFQLEEGKVPTSPIKTTSASATRAADQNSSKVHKWYNPSGYVLYFEFEVPSNGTSRVITELRDKNNTTNERLTLKVNDWDAIELEIYRDTKQVFMQDNVNFVPNTLNKVAVVVKENSCSLYVNGVHFATDTDCIIPELDIIYLGKPSWDGWYLNGNIKLAGAFPKVLTNTELEGLTT